MTSLYREAERPTEVTSAALEFHDVFRIYRSGPAETVALRGLDLQIAAREIVAIYGPSGSGKSTMIRIAAALDQPSAGDVRAFGVSLGRLVEDRLANYRAHRLALVLQSGNLWPELSARENVAFALRLAGRSDGADEALEEFGLGSAAGRRAGVLSGGEQQRVAIAAAAAREAPLVLADEPTAELDDENERLVLGALRRLRDDHGSSVVAVTHSRRVASEADRVIELRDGRVR